MKCHLNVFNATTWSVIVLLSIALSCLCLSLVPALALPPPSHPAPLSSILFRLWRLVLGALVGTGAFVVAVPAIEESLATAEVRAGFVRTSLRAK